MMSSDMRKVTMYASPRYSHTQRAPNAATWQIPPEPRPSNEAWLTLSEDRSRRGETRGVCDLSTPPQSLPTFCYRNNEDGYFSGTLCMRDLEPVSCVVTSPVLHKFLSVNSQCPGKRQRPMLQLLPTNPERVAIRLRLPSVDFHPVVIYHCKMR